jgi:hypothetical protein
MSTTNPPAGTAEVATPSVELLPIDSPPAASAVAAAPPAVAEISRERSDPPHWPAELRLFADEAPPASPVRREPSQPAETIAAERQERRPRDPHPGGNGNAARTIPPTGTPSPNGEPRRTLHLSLSGGDGGQRHEAQPHAVQSPAMPGAGERVVSPLTGTPGQAPGRGSGPSAPAGNGTAMRSAQEPPAAKEVGNFIDHALRERVDGDIAAFLAAFDAALDHDTAESRAGLREATDRLLRAGARTRIELERLEARVPLVPREKGREEARAFRQR